MLSSKCKYAIRATLYLALVSNIDKKFSLVHIAEKLQIPSPFLGKILQELVRKGIVSSVKGPNGGFYISEENNKISVIKIVETIDGLGAFETCGLGLKKCSNEHPCPIHNEFKGVRNQLFTIFNTKTIADLAVQIEENNEFLVV